MTDFDREQTDYWYADARRKSRLIGGISFWADASSKAAGTPSTVSADKALTEIRRLLAEYNAERAGQTTGGGA